MNGGISALGLALHVLLITGVDAFGQITWRRTYGGYGTDEARSVRQTSDGGYVVAGSTGSFGNGSSDVYVIKLDELGEPMWSRTYGGIGVEEAIACRELGDGYIIAGSTSLGLNGGYDLLLIRTDLQGYPLWERNYGTSDWDLCHGFDVTNDGFLLGGTSFGTGSMLGCSYVVRTDLNGDTLWTRSWGGAFTEECFGLASSVDLGFVMVGRSATPSGYDDAFMRKCDESGTEQWLTYLGGDSADYLTGVAQAPSGDFVANGGTRSFSPFQRLLIASLDPLGSLQWQHLVGMISDAGGTEIAPNNYGGFVFTGYNTLNLGARDMILTVTDVDGYFMHGFNYGDGLPADGYSTSPTSDGGYVIAGWCEGYGPGPRSMYVVKTDSMVLTASLDVNTHLDPLGIGHEESHEAFQLHPNPVRRGGTIVVTDHSGDHGIITISDQLGRIMLMVPYRTDQQSVQLPEDLCGAFIISLYSTRDQSTLRMRLIIQ